MYCYGSTRNYWRKEEPSGLFNKEVTDEVLESIIGRL